MKISIFVSIFWLLPIAAMDYNNNNMRPWVVAASQIKVRSTKEDITIAINKDSTISDLKNYLSSDQGIPANQQALIASWKNAWTLWLTTKYSKSLADNKNVKEVMNEYNTDTLGLYLTQQPHQPSANS